MDNEMMDDSVWGAIEYWHERITGFVEEQKDGAARLAAKLLPARVAWWAYVRVMHEERMPDIEVSLCEFEFPLDDEVFN